MDEDAWHGVKAGQCDGKALRDLAAFRPTHRLVFSSFEGFREWKFTENSAHDQWYSNNGIVIDRMEARVLSTWKHPKKRSGERCAW